jgi:hypothetical protein
MNLLNGSIHHQRPPIDADKGPLAGQLGGLEQIRISPIGSDLTAADFAALEARWIDPELARRARLRRVDSLTGGEIVGRKGGNYSGILIQYFHPGSNQAREYRLRRDQPDLEYDPSGNLKARQKYLSPPGRSNMLYLPPGVSASLLSTDPHKYTNVL